jgi:protein-arginine kinase activator protein McsA
LKSEHQKTVSTLIALDRASYEKNPQKLIRQKELQMNAAVKILDFESAAILRDEIAALKGEPTVKK